MLASDPAPLREALWMMGASASLLLPAAAADKLADTAARRVTMDRRRIISIQLLFMAGLSAVAVARGRGQCCLECGVYLQVNWSCLDVLIMELLGYGVAWMDFLFSVFVYPTCVGIGYFGLQKAPWWFRSRKNVCPA
jgi:hypothetical protein